MAEPIAAQAIAQANRTAPVEVYGAVSEDTATVRLKYTLGGATRFARAELIHVKDHGALEQSGIAAPFGYYLGELPAKASNVTALAKDGAGRTLGRTAFEALLRSQPRRAFISGASR